MTVDSGIEHRQFHFEAGRQDKGGWLPLAESRLHRELNLPQAVRA